MPSLIKRLNQPWCSLLSQTLSFSLTHRCTYIQVTMKWKKDPFFDPIDHLTKQKDLKIVISLKNLILSLAPAETGIPISAVSKLGRQLEISGRVAAFLRRYPAIFEEFTGPQYNLPWFRLTQEAIEIDQSERAVYEARKGEIVDRLRRLLLMSRERTLPLRIVQGMSWYLGLNDDFVKNQDEILDFGFEIVDVGDGEKGLRLMNKNEILPFSALQKNTLKKLGGKLELSPNSAIAFPLFPSKGLRLKRKIKIWLGEFQNLPYISPYEDFSNSNLNPSSDVAEKRVAGVLHELLSIFVDNSAERRRLFCLKKYLGLPQKVHRVFERHPHLFYLLLKSKTCFVVLKEAYMVAPHTVIEQHPLLDFRKKYVDLMNKSKDSLIKRRNNKPLAIKS